MIIVIYCGTILDASNWCGEVHKQKCNKNVLFIVVVYYVPDCCPDPALQSVASFLWSKQIEVVMPKACLRWIPVPNTAYQYHCQVRWEEMLMLSGTLHESS